jgi:hypothetical protein
MGNRALHKHEGKEEYQPDNGDQRAGIGGATHMVSHYRYSHHPRCSPKVRLGSSHHDVDLMQSTVVDKGNVCGARQQFAVQFR